MPRFKVNRWWTLILALSLGFALVAFTSTSATANKCILDGNGGVTPGAPPGDGDPDIPISRSKRSQPNASPQGAASVSTGRVAGDGMPVDSVMMWHFRILLQGLRLLAFVRL